MKFLTHKKFEKAFAKLTTTQQQAVAEALSAFVMNRSASRLRDHALKGRLAGLRSFSAAWDLRIVYREEDGFITIILLDV